MLSFVNIRKALTDIEIEILDYRKMKRDIHIIRFECFGI